MAYEESTGRTVDYSQMQTMEGCKASFMQGVWFTVALIIFIRIWFSYTIFQWYQELKEEMTRNQDAVERVDEIELQSAARRRDFQAMEEHINY